MNKNRSNIHITEKGDQKMVDIKTNYELNHIYRLILEQDVIQIGQNQTIATLDEVLYDRSLALSGDLKRIPILRSIISVFNIAAPVTARMSASGITLLKAHLSVYNDNIADVEELVYESDCLIHYNVSTNTGFIEIQNPDWEFEGGLVLNNEIRIQVTTDTNANVAGAALTEGTLDAILFLEIDWKEMTKKEMDEYIREFAFAKK